MLLDGLRRKIKMRFDLYDEKLAARNQTVDGMEIPSSIPMAPPIGYFKQPSMIDHIRNMVRSENLRLAAEAQGAESFEEADDFDVDDDPEVLSGYEFEDQFEPPIPPEPAKDNLSDASSVASATEPAEPAKSVAPKEPTPDKSV